MTGSTDPYVDLVDDAVQTVAAQHRFRQGWRRDASAASATWVATLLGLHGQSSPVAVEVANSGVHHGVIARVGVDVVVVEGDSEVAYVALDAAVAVVADEVRLCEHSPRRVDRTFLEELERNVAQGQDLSLSVRSGALRTGRLALIGEDVLTLKTASGVAFVPAAAITVVRCRR